MTKIFERDSNQDSFDVPDIPDRPIVQQPISTQNNTSEDSALDQRADICCEVCAVGCQLISVILLAVSFCL